MPNGTCLCPNGFSGPACLNDGAYPLMTIGEPVAVGNNDNTFWFISDKPTSDYYYYQVDSFPLSDGNGGWIEGTLEFYQNFPPYSDSLFDIDNPVTLRFILPIYKEASIQKNIYNETLFSFTGSRC